MCKRLNQYRLITNIYITATQQAIPSYGIEWRADPAVCCRDISLNKGFVKYLVTLLNRHRLSPIHLRDVVEDRLP